MNLGTDCRLKIPPFERARTVLGGEASTENTIEVKEEGSEKEKNVTPEVKEEQNLDDDFLLTCHKIATEVVKLSKLNSRAHLTHVVLNLFFGKKYICAALSLNLQPFL